MKGDTEHTYTPGEAAAGAAEAKAKAGTVEVPALPAVAAVANGRCARAHLAKTGAVNVVDRGTLVEVVAASRVYNQGGREITALAPSTCTVRTGDYIALIGPSGSGKSTLLHLMSGLDTPTSGVIRWPGLGSRETLRPLLVSLVLQAPSLLAPLTALENVALPLLLGGVAEQDAYRMAAEALKQLDLGGIGGKLPEELSGGQAQRVAVARAVASRPKLLLADEPTGQLDHATAEYLLDVLLAALRPTDCALVIATHDPVVAARMECTWLIEHGVLEVGGSYN